MCEETVEDGCDSLLMSVCGSVGGRGTSGSGMGRHGNVLLKTNVGQGEAEVEGRPDLVGRGGRRATDETLLSSILRNLPYGDE